MAGQRDYFPAAIRNALAARAAFRCSICDQLTVGPSDESPTATSSIGTAAHICAASPGGRRYDETMIPEARAGIGNGIWLCANHGRLVDTDDVTYTADALHRFKAEHEARCKQALGFDVRAGRPGSNLVALGPETVCLRAQPPAGGLSTRRRDRTLHCSTLEKLSVQPAAKTGDPQWSR